MALITASRRWLFLLAVSASLVVLLVFATWHGHLNSDMAHSILRISHDWKSSLTHSASSWRSLHPWQPVKQHRHVLFDQIWSLDEPEPYDYPTLAAACRIKPATEDAPYFNCTHITLGLTSAMSQVRSCLKMVVDSGSNLVLPRIAARDPNDIHGFHTDDPSTYVDYEQWFDADRLREVMAKACPQTRIVHPKDLGKDITVKHNVTVRFADDPFYEMYRPYFWAGKNFREWFPDNYRFALDRQPPPPAEEPGITVVSITSEFLIFKLMEDSSRFTLDQWTDLALAMRWPRPQRVIVNELLANIGGPYYSVHFRTENDSGWAAAVDQMRRDLDFADKAWELFGAPNESDKPAIYVGVGDETQAEYFIKGAAERGWKAHSKYSLLANSPETMAMVNALPFDSMGAIDLGMFVKGDFFIGIGGSAMSFTAANFRDPTGHYRGSSLEFHETDDGAGNHLGHDFDNPGYPCCL